MNNKIFDINGHRDSNLLDALRLAFKNQYDNFKDHTAGSWKITQEKGLILCRGNHQKGGVNLFPTPLTADQVFPIVKQYLEDSNTWDNGKFIDHWDKPINFDGSLSKGWRVYCDDWGHIDGDCDVIIAIRPAYMWHGK